MGEQSNLSIGHSPGNEPGKTKTVNAESSNAWYVNMNNGNVNTNNKTNAGRVRPVSATDKPIYDIPPHLLLTAGHGHHHQYFKRRNISYSGFDHYTF